MNELIRVIAGYAGPGGFDGQCEVLASDTRLVLASFFAGRNGPGAFRSVDWVCQAPPRLSLRGTPLLWWSAALPTGRPGPRTVCADWAHDMRDGRLRWATNNPDDRSRLLNRLKGRTIE